MTNEQQEEMIRRVLEISRRNGRTSMSIVTSILVALAPTLAATAAWLKANSTHDLVNSRMTELLELTRLKATQAGRDERTGGSPEDAELAQKIEELLKNYRQP